jgi:hypothetical protein
MNALERPVIERQLAALDSLIGRNGGASCRRTATPRAARTAGRAEPRTTG